ncbi:MAG: C4-type zinc ribbon domain-containing protein, partial [Candidatus Microthrix subdominans]
DAASEVINSDLDSLAARRAELAEPLDDALLTSYDQLRTRFGGVAIAQLSGGRCSGCHLSLPAVELDTIKRAPAAQQVSCPECGRLLAR